MLGYLTDTLPDVELKVTGFAYQDSLEARDVADYERIDSSQDFIRTFEVTAGKKELLFVTGSLYFISEVRACLISSDRVD